MSDPSTYLNALVTGDPAAVARAISLAGADGDEASSFLASLPPRSGSTHRIGVTGPPGVGKSTLIGSLVKLIREQGKTVAVIACDPRSPRTGGAFLGDRMRMGTRGDPDPGVFIRSFSSPGPGAELPRSARSAAVVLEAAGFERVILETSGAGQNDPGLSDHVDTVVLVLSPEAGDEFQVLKAGIMETADILVVNRSDRPGADELAGLLEEEVSSSPHSRARVLSTVATRGEGVPALLVAIETSFEKSTKKSNGKSTEQSVEEKKDSAAERTKEKT